MAAVPEIMMLKKVYVVLFKPEKVPMAPLSINVEINNKCNLNCIMCQREEIFKLDSAFDLLSFQKVYEQIKSPHVALHGYGEPLLSKDLVEILGYLRKKGAQTSITSNLIALTDDLIYGLIKAQMGLLKVSFDAYTRETYQMIRRTNGLDTVVANIKKIIKVKEMVGSVLPAIRLSYTILPNNYREIAGFIELAVKELKQKTIFFQTLLFRHSLLDGVQLGEMDREDFYLYLKKAKAFSEKIGSKTNLGDILNKFDTIWDHQYDHSPSERTNYHICLKPWITTFVSSNGDVKPCDCLGLTDIVMGNLFREPFAEIWNSSKYRNFRRNIAAGKHPHQICRDCIPNTLWDWIKYRAFNPNYLDG